MRWRGVKAAVVPWRVRGGWRKGGGPVTTWEFPDGGLLCGGSGEANLEAGQLGVEELVGQKGVA